MEVILKKHINENHTITLQMANAKKANALDMDLCQQLINALKDAEREKNIKVIIITGEDKFFSAGGDIKAMAEKRDMFAGDEKQLKKTYINTVQKLQKTIFELNKPVIAAVNGVAAGAGNDLVAFCDIAIASEKAKFSESFINLNLISGDGGYWIQPRILGKSNAFLMAYTGDLFSAEQALQMGLVSKVVLPEKLMSETLELAKAIAEKPMAALQQTRRLILDGLQSTFAETLEQSAEAQSKLHHTEEHHQAVKRLIERIQRKRTHTQ